MRLPFVLALCFCLSLAFAQKVPRQPFIRHQVEDRLGRTVQYYLSEKAVSESENPPLIVYIQGSGPSSHFISRGEGQLAGAFGNSSIADVCRGKARVLLVDKPGIAYLEESKVPGGPETFRKEHTLERWTEAIRAAVDAYLTVNGAKSVLVAGHSEGGLVAARLARIEPRVSHVALLAGGGPSQLFDLVTLSRRGEFFRQVSEDPEKRVQYVLDQWQKILQEPDSFEKLFFGHAYRRWSSFLASSPIDELKGVRAKIFIAQGGEDKAVDPASADALFAQLFSLGKSPKYLRVEHADHSFNRSDKPKEFDGWSDLWQQVFDWFRTESPAKSAQIPGPK